MLITSLSFYSREVWVTPVHKLFIKSFGFLQDERPYINAILFFLFLLTLRWVLKKITKEPPHRLTNFRINHSLGAVAHITIAGYLLCSNCSKNLRYCISLMAARHSALDSSWFDLNVSQGCPAKYSFFYPYYETVLWLVNCHITCVKLAKLGVTAEWASRGNPTTPFYCLYVSSL